jgi:glycosyltransferase involved in cell wall biosynthesis
MRKVGYDAQAFLSANGGTGKGVQLRNLVGPFLDTFVGFASTEPNGSGLPLIREGFAGHNMWQQFSLPASLRRHSIDVFLAPYNVAPLLLPRHVELILVLHDTILLKGYRKPDLRGRQMDAYRRWLIPRSVARAKIVLTVSEHARSEILRAYPRTEVRVIPCSISARWFSPRSLESREGYVLMVTSSAPHKNAMGGLKGYAQYARRAGAGARALKVVGLGESAEPYRAEASALGVSHLVTFLPFISEAELLAMYHGAGALLFPSFAEGFGIPLLEAMATGTPAVAARATSLPEVGGDAAVYFDPADEVDIANVLEKVLGDPALSRSLSGRGLQRAQSYHPEAVARQVREFWQEVAGIAGTHGPELPIRETAAVELQNLPAV